MPSPTMNRIIYGGQKNYVLDRLGADAVNSLALGMSYTRLTKKYKGACLRITRASDFATLDIEFSAGYIAINQVAAFCVGTEGRCTIWYNQSILAGANNAIQATWGNMPIIYSGGVFNTDGLNFSAQMTVQNYTGLSITSYPLSIYCNFKKVSSSGSGFLFSRSDNVDNKLAYAILYDRANNRYLLYLNDSASVGYTACSPGLNKIIVSWQTTNVGGIKFNTNSTETSATYAVSPILDRTLFSIAARTNGAIVHGGNIKTIAIFNSDQYANYSNFVNGGM